ncbi:MAG TPA: branched-chain amino acid ABC transporter permease [Chloroflexota bacterium]|nr:branched-chain amino acid ABC transporter permease [Chloroflexota bacterium]
MRTLLLTLAALALALALASALPAFYRTLLVLIAIWALLALSVDLLLGHTGLASLGHGAFFGLGGYVAGILSVRQLLGGAWVLETLTAVCVVVLFAALLGLLVLRTRGAYFMMVTLAVAQILWGAAQVSRPLTGGDDGLRGVLRPDVPLLSALPGGNGYYYLVVVLAVLVFVAFRFVIRSPFGYALNGIRQSETRMAALGYNVFLYKYLAFVLSAALAGFAGVLFVYYNQYIHPNALGILTSAQALLMPFVGGPGTLLGPALGAFVVILVQDTLAGLTERWQLPMGLFYIVVVLLMPRGILWFAASLLRSGRWRVLRLAKPRLA